MKVIVSNKRILFICLVFTVLGLSHQYSQSCQETLDRNSVVNGIKNMDFSNPYLASGWGLNDMGKYDTCLSNKNNSFLMVQIKYKVEQGSLNTTLPIYIGECTPKECENKEDMEFLKGKIMNLSGMSNSSILVFSSEEENKKNKAFNFTSGLILTILVIYLLFALGIVKVIHECIYAKKDQSENTGENNKYGNLSASETDAIAPKDSDAEVIDRANNTNATKEEFLAQKSRSESIEGKSKFQLYLYGCFDFKNNVAKIFELRNTEDNELKIYDGIRFLACCIVVLCHCVTLIDQIPIRNPETAYDYFKSFSWQIIFNGTWAVDVFFSLSGFFLSYISIKRINDIKKGAFGKLCFAILMRLLRIWPVYVFMFFIYWRFYVYVLDGPLSGYIFNKELDSCNYQWPFMITLLTNFTYGIWETSYPFCMSWYWYIPNDFQLSIIGTLLLMYYADKKVIFYSILGAVNLGFMIAEAVLIYQFNLDSITPFHLGSNPDYYDHFYMKIYTRGVPFFIGYIFGIMYAEYKKAVKEDQNTKLRRFFEAVKNSKPISFTLWFLGVFMILFLTYLTHWNYDTKWDFFPCFLYNFLSRKVFIIAMFTFALPIMLGNFYILGGWLGASVFVPLAKLSFCLYILHPLVIKYVFLNFRSVYFYQGFYYLLYGFSFITITYILAIPVSAVFEMPFQGVREVMMKLAKEAAKRRASNRVEDKKVQLVEE